MVDVSKKGNVEKGVALQKKRAKLQNGNFEKRVMPLLVDNHSVAEQL